MRIKLLLVPLLIIASVVLIIGWIQPAYTSIQTQRELRAKKEVELGRIEVVLNNASVMNSALDNNGELEQFVLKYLPKDMDEGRAGDALNFLATQSGLAITAIEKKEEEIKVAVTPSAEPTSLNPLGASETPLTDAPLVEIMPVPKNYSFTLSVQGSYENIRTFLERVVRSNRLVGIGSFEIKPFSMQDTAQLFAKDLVTQPTNDLKAHVVVDFAYIPAKKIDSALNVATFQKAELDFSPIIRAQERISAPVPALENPETGKPNPFQ